MAALHVIRRDGWAGDRSRHAYQDRGMAERSLEYNGAAGQQAFAMDVAESASRMRRVRLALSMALAIVSRIAALAVQIVALPVALSVLGAIRYAEFLTIQASFGWFGLAGLGITVALPGFLSAANVRHDEREQRELVLTSLAILGVGMTMLMGFIVGAAAIISPERLLGVHAEFVSGEFRIAFYVGAFFLCARMFVAFVASVRGGYQELHRVYAMTAIANLLVILWSFPSNGHVWVMFCFMFAPLIVLLVIDFAIMLARRPYLVSGDWHPLATFKRLMPTSLNAVLKQVSAYLMTSGTIVVLVRLVPLKEVAAFGSLMSVITLLASGYGALFAPMLAAMANAHSHSDRTWFWRAYLGGVAVVMAGAGVLLIVAFFWGTTLMQLWLHADLGVTRTLCTALALYFMCWMLSEYHFVVLASMGKLRGLGKIYVWEGIVTLGCGGMLASRYGLEGMAIGLGIGAAAFSVVYLPLRAWRIITRDGWEQTDLDPGMINDEI
jgi:O-antigen/teichoic acid export membrane protein